MDDSLRRSTAIEQPKHTPPAEEPVHDERDHGVDDGRQQVQERRSAEATPIASSTMVRVGSVAGTGDVFGGFSRKILFNIPRTFAWTARALVEVARTTAYAESSGRQGGRNEP